MHFLWYYSVLFHWFAWIFCILMSFLSGFSWFFLKFLRSDESFPLVPCEVSAILSFSHSISLDFDRSFCHSQHLRCYFFRFWVKFLIYNAPQASSLSTQSAIASSTYWWFSISSLMVTWQFLQITLTLYLQHVNILKSNKNRQLRERPISSTVRQTITKTDPLPLLECCCLHECSAVWWSVLAYFFLAPIFESSIDSCCMLLEWCLWFVLDDGRSSPLATALSDC